jgi:hypothetical protein
MENLTFFAGMVCGAILTIVILAVIVSILIDDDDLKPEYGDELILYGGGA